MACGKCIIAFLVLSLSFVHSNIIQRGEKATEGTFWHVTDMHYDSYYNEKADSRQEVCPSSYGEAAINPGSYGDYKCDAPWKLIKSAVDFMTETTPNPGFIIWTGDDTLHTSNEDEYLGEDVVVDIITQQTNLLRTNFPSTPIFPCLGNHDFHLKNQMPEGNSYILSKVAEIWCPFLPDDQCQFFNKTGSYRTFLPSNNNTMIISLNTVVWYQSNHLVDGTGDPNGQFVWLDETLSEAEANDFKVYIIGHIPPGYFELVDDVYWLYPEYSRRYTDLVVQYSHVIVGQLFGHHHTDSYRMFYDSQGNAVSTMWIAPGVTPWMTNLPGVTNGANNPGVRLFEYNTISGEPKDYVQYYLDLEKANSGESEQWLVEYRATTAFHIDDISTASMQNLTSILQSAQSCSTDCEEASLIMKDFARFNSVSYVTDACDDTCQRQHVCAITSLDEESHTKCIGMGKNSANVSSASWRAATLLAFTFAINFISGNF